MPEDKESDIGSLKLKVRRMGCRKCKSHNLRCGYYWHLSFSCTHMMLIVMILYVPKDVRRQRKRQKVLKKIHGLETKQNVESVV
jgi:hypothetical protein